jgi:hypothetical protein
MATDDQAKQALARAQTALHSIYGRDHAAATALWGDLQAWAKSGDKPLIGHAPSPTHALLDAHAVLQALQAKGGQDAADAAAIAAVLALPAAQIIKAGGFAPPSQNPKTVSQSFTDSAKATVDDIGIGAFLAALVNPHTWLRVAEVGIGVLLLAVGVAKLTNVVPAATKIARTVGKLPI